MSERMCCYHGCKSPAHYSMVMNGEVRFYCDPHFCLAESVAMKARDLKAIQSRTKLDVNRLEKGSTDSER